MNVAHLLNTQAENFSEKSAFIFKDSPVTFSQLRQNVFKLANALKKVGVQKGEKIAIYLPNWPEYLYSYLAIFSLGAVVVPLDYMLTEEELISCLSHSETKVLIAATKENISFSSLKQKIPSLETVISCTDKGEDSLSYSKLLADANADLELTPVSDSDPAMIMYTSGTTGRPKGILMNYRHLDAVPQAMKYFVDLTSNDIKLSCLPLSHVAGLIYIQNLLYFGLTLVLMERFSPLEFVKNIQDRRVTCFHLVPSMYYAMMQLKELDKFDLSSLRWIVVFGAPSAPQILKRFHKFCPNAKFLNGWGMTETNAPNVVLPLDSDRMESVGKPAPWIAIRIVDDSDKELGVGAMGEIVIKSWVVMQGYYKDEQASREAIRNGWFHTGDLGRFDEEGFLYIVGRKKEMVKVAGQLVYTPEVEAVLYKYPDIIEVAVIGIKDSLRGETLQAFAVLKDDTYASENDIREFAKKHLAHFKVPQKFEFVDKLPKNRAGKVDKQALRQEEGKL